MSHAAQIESPPDEAVEIQRAAHLLGGAAVLRARPRTALDVHALLLRGLPAMALTHLVEGLAVIRPTGSLEKAIGMSLRTLQRRRDGAARPLSLEQSGRTWKFAEILAKATAVFGSQAEAEQWLERPAIGLNQSRPIDLLSTPAGVALVEAYLVRLEYGVYA